MYQQASESGGDQQAGAEAGGESQSQQSSGSEDEDVVDADYEEVKDDNK